MVKVRGRAPGRLDLLGGVADYSGALVLEMPTRQGTEVTLCPDTAFVVGPAAFAPDELERLAGLDDAAVREELSAHPRWTHYVIGVVLVLLGVALMMKPGALGHSIKPVDFYAISLIFLIGPSLTRWLNRDVRFTNLGGQPGAVSGFLLGFAFAFGWTPCIGPILATVLAIAATKDTVWQGVLLLACYSAGLAIPFLVTALGINGFLKFYTKFRRHLHTVEVFSGALLLVIGALIYTNKLTWLSGKLTFLNRFSQ